LIEGFGDDINVVTIDFNKATPIGKSSNFLKHPIPPAQYTWIRPDVARRTSEPDESSDLYSLGYIVRYMCKAAEVKCDDPTFDVLVSFQKKCQQCSISQFLKTNGRTAILGGKNMTEMINEFKFV